MYRLMVYVTPGKNPNHPEGGWFKNREDEDREELEAMIDRACRYGNDRSRYRIDEL